MQYTLRDGLYHCLAGSSVIFLDAQQNRYFAVSATCEAAFLLLKARHGESFPGAAEALSALTAGGHLIECEAGASNFLDVKLCQPVSDVNSYERHQAGPFTIIQAFYWEATSFLQLRLLPLSSVLRRATPSSRRTHSPRREVEKKLAVLLAGFDYTALAFGIADRCLVRSLAAYSLLRRNRIAAQLVLGVRSAPFGAHAWVQYEDIVLNDTVEQVRSYTPIMVLG